jgi:hypothetical protein
VVYGLVIGTLFFSYNATLHGKHNFILLEVQCSMAKYFKRHFIFGSYRFLLGFFTTTRLWSGRYWSILNHFSFVQIFEGNIKALIWV